MSVYVPSGSEIDREEHLLRDVHWRSERDALSELLRIVRSASDDEQFFRAHVSLLARLKARQDMISGQRAEIKELGAHRRELASLNPKPLEQLRSIQGEIQELQSQLNVQRALHALLLGVGDALVWRRSGCDRAAITALGQGAQVGWLSHGRGWDAEASAVDGLWRDGILAVVNDATTCIRLGDLTCFFDDRVEVREIKAGKLVAPTSPQQVRLGQAITLINEGRAKIDGNRRAIVRCSDPLDTHLDQLPALLSRARRDAHRGSGIHIAARCRT